MSHSSEGSQERSLHELEKEAIRKEAEYQKQIDRETYPDLSREERRDRDKEIERGAKELY